MKNLKICPKCSAKLISDENGRQYCKVCDYWTKQGSVRLDSIMILD